MATRTLLDYASPTSINTDIVQAPTGFLRNILVVVKSDTADTTISTITSKPSVSFDKCIDNLFDKGMNKVSYIRLENTDISNLSLNNEYATVLFNGFSIEELKARNIGSFNGVIGYEISNENDGDPDINTTYTPIADGTVIGSLFGTGLSNVSWKNCQYRTISIEEKYVVKDLGLMNTLYDSKISFIGRDDVVGTKIASFFIGGESFSKPYIEKEITLNLQTNNINLLSQELSYNIQDAGIIRSFNSNYIQKFYVETGLIEDFDYSVDLTTDNNFISNLDIRPVVAVWKILMQVGRKL